MSAVHGSSMFAEAFCLGDGFAPVAWIPHRFRDLPELFKAKFTYLALVKCSSGNSAWFPVLFYIHYLPGALVLLQSRTLLIVLFAILFVCLMVEFLRIESSSSLMS